MLSLGSAGTSSWSRLSGFVVGWQFGEQQFRAILANPNDALTYESSGRLRYLTAAALADEFRYLHPASLEAGGEKAYGYYLGGDAVPQEVWPLKRSLNAETFSGVEVRIIHKATRKRYLHGCGTWLVERGGSLCIIKAHDITERREAKERITNRP